MANPWVIFNDLISGSKKTMAQVSGTSSSGKIIVIQVGDITPIHVDSNGGNFPVGSYVFIEGGAVSGQAPNIRSIATELVS